MFWTIMGIVLSGIGYLKYKENKHWESLTEEEKREHWKAVALTQKLLSESNINDTSWDLSYARY